MQQLLGGPRAALNSADVAATLALTNGVKVRHGVDVLTSAMVLTDLALKVQEGEVVWAYRPPDDVTGVTNTVALVRRTASLVVIATSPIWWASYRYRLWTEMLSPAGVWVRFNLGVFVCSMPPVDDDGMVQRYRLQLADKTFRYNLRALTDPLSIAAGTNCASWVAADLASTFGEGTVNIPTSTVTLVTGKTFPANTSRLAVYNDLLRTAAFDDLTCDEDNGYPRSRSLADLAGQGAEITYGPNATGKIVTAGTVESLLAEVPNQVRFVARTGPTLATEGNGISTVTNQSTGPFSVDQRGETILQVVQVEAENQAQLAAIATADAQRFFAGGGLRYIGKVGLNPRHSDRDVVELIKPRLGLSGNWLCTEWRYPMRNLDNADAALMQVTFEKRAA